MAALAFGGGGAAVLSDAACFGLGCFYLFCRLFCSLFFFFGGGAVLCAFSCGAALRFGSVFSLCCVHFACHARRAAALCRSVSALFSGDSRLFLTSPSLRLYSVGVAAPLYVCVHAFGPATAYFFLWLPPHALQPPTRLRATMPHSPCGWTAVREHPLLPAGAHSGPAEGVAPRGAVRPSRRAVNAPRRPHSRRVDVVPPPPIVARW